MKNGWQTKRLGDVAKTQYGLSEPMNEEGKGFKIFRMGELQNGRLIDTGRMKYADISRADFEQYQLHTGDVLFNRTNSFELVGKTGIFTLHGDYCFASYLVRLNLDRQKVLPEFLNYFMNSGRFQKSVKEKASQSINQANINATILSNELIRFPESLAEQRRIVGILDKAFDGIATAKANAEKNLQNAHALFESHLQAVFTQHGKEWAETSLGAEIDLLTGFPFKSSQYTDSANGVRLLRGDNIVQGSLRWDDVKRWPASEAAEYKRYELSFGDVVLAMDRPWVKAGLKRAQIWESDLPCLLVQRTARLRGNGSLDNRFLVYLIGSAGFTYHILGVQTGIGVPHISGQQIKDFQFVKPPLSKQREIVTRLDALHEETQRLESLYQRKLAALDELKKSLLHQAFSGQL
ncbi:MAG TPA: restriction endonuclease subunit S [Gemmataceae bacterium]|nr:restriction endonuclease subunit S [Gemmataceae bacterium]